MNSIIKWIKLQWWCFKQKIFHIEPDWLQYGPPPLHQERTLFAGDLIFDKETETVWVVDCDYYFTITDDGVWTEEVLAYRLNDYLNYRFFLSAQVIKMNY